MDSSVYVMEMQHVSKYFKGKQGGIVTAVDDVNLGISKGETFSLVGESGSGKTTVGKMAVGLIPPSKGEIILGGIPARNMNDNERFKNAQYIHQDPYGSLDPYSTVYATLSRPLKYLYKVKDQSEIEERVMNIVELIGLPDDYVQKTIQELSGGERQRVMIARAFMGNPQLVVADEPTTMIDFVHREEVMLLISNLKERIGLSLLLITHDISVASKNSNRMAVMNKGKIVEVGTTDSVVSNPMHPYTKLLMSVSPDFVINNIEQGKLEEYLPKNSSVTNRPSKGCVYSLNCPFASEKCFQNEPELKGDSDHKVACFLY